MPFPISLFQPVKVLELSSSSCTFPPFLFPQGLCKNTSGSSGPLGCSKGC